MLKICGGKINMCAVYQAFAKMFIGTLNNANPLISYYLKPLKPLCCVYDTAKQYSLFCSSQHSYISIMKNHSICTNMPLRCQNNASLHSDDIMITRTITIIHDTRRQNAQSYRALPHRSSTTNEESCLQYPTFSMITVSIPFD